MTDKERIAIGDELITLMAKNNELMERLLAGRKREEKLKALFFGQKEKAA